MNPGGSILLSGSGSQRVRIEISTVQLSSPLNRFALAHGIITMNKFRRSYLFRFTILTVQTTEILQFLDQGFPAIPPFRDSLFKRF